MFKVFVIDYQTMLCVCPCRRLGNYVDVLKTRREFGTQQDGAVRGEDSGQPVRGAIEG
jgi:hypothetical protein